MGIKLGKKLYQPALGTIGFWCPGCDGYHGIPVDGSRGWQWNGDADRPTVAPSIFVNSPGGHYHNPQAFSCHSFVRDGNIQFLSDCSHPLAGLTVELPDWADEGFGPAVKPAKA